MRWLNSKLPDLDPLPTKNRERLIRAVTAVNRLSAKAARVEIESGGSHQIGDRSIRSCYAALNAELDKPFSTDKKIRDCLSPAGPLEGSEFKLVRGRSYPIPTLALVRIDPWKRGAALTLLEYVAGANVCDRFFPLNDRLLVDGAGVRYVDATGLEAASDGENRRVSLALRDDYVEALLEQAYLLERNGNFDLALFAHDLRLASVLAAFRIRVFCDHLGAPAPQRLWLRFEDPHREREVARLAYGGLVPEPILEADNPDDRVRAELAHLFHERVAKPVREFFARPVTAGGAVPIRQQGNLRRLGRDGGKPAPIEWQSNLRSIEREARIFCEEAVAMLLEKRTPSVRVGARFEALDAADLESPNRVRRYMAVAEVIRPGYEEFMRGSEVAKRYERSAKPLPHCPMPIDGPEPLDMRLKAALFSLLLADLKGTVLRVPETLFEWTAPKSMGEEEAKAQKSIHDTLVKALRQRMLVEVMRQLSPSTARLSEVWLTMVEGRFQHTGCGVDSVDNLLFPCLFFHEQLFEHLLRNEHEIYRQSWSRLRSIGAQLPPAVSARAWPEVRRIIAMMFKEFSELSLRQVHGNKAGVNNPLPPPVFEPFEAPKNFFSERFLQIEEASAPVQVVTAAPGNPADYERMVARLTPHIQKLRRLESQPMEEQAGLAGHAKFGPLLDPLRLPLYPLGHLLFSRVSYAPEPIRGKRRLVAILMDFSGSMDSCRVDTAKQAAIVIAEGLHGGGASFDLEFYLYNTAGPLYRLCLIYKSSDRRFGGRAALASITNRDYTSGDGWNPDAAALLAMKSMFDQNPEAVGAVLVHLGDHEYCSSLGHRFPDARQEVAYAVQKLLDAGKYHYIAARVGKDEDPLPTTIPHSYIHFPDQPLTVEKMADLYHILRRHMG